MGRVANLSLNSLSRLVAVYPMINLLTLSKSSRLQNAPLRSKKTSPLRVQPTCHGLTCTRHWAKVHSLPPISLNQKVACLLQVIRRVGRIGESQLAADSPDPDQSRVSTPNRISSLHLILNDLVWERMRMGSFVGNPDVEARFPDLHPAFDGRAAIVEANRCLNCFDAPCMGACPTHIDVPRFIKKIASGNVIGRSEERRVGKECRS